MKITRIIIMCFCLLAINQASFAGYSEMWVDPLYLNLGEVEIGSSAHGYFLAANIGVASSMMVNYRIMEGSSPCMIIIAYNPFPACVVDSDNIWLEVLFTPTSVGHFTMVVEISATSPHLVINPIQYVTIEGTGVLPSYMPTEYKLPNSDGSHASYFGSSVSISGHNAIAGAYGDDVNGSDAGAAYVFQWDGTDWSEQAKLMASNGAAGDNFGYAVSVDNNYAIVGAIGDDDVSSAAGSAYIFRWDGAAWSEQSKITGDIDADVNFGRSVCLSSDRAIVGAHGEPNIGLAKGTAYIFQRDGTNWRRQARLNLNDAEFGDYFGHSAAIDGDYAIVGAYGDGGYGQYIGSAFVYHWDGTSWTEQAMLTASDAHPENYFGYSVALDGNYAVVGAWGDDGYSGAAYVFKRDGAAWTEQAKLAASDGAAEDLFGVSVSINGDYVVIGACYDDDKGVNSGSSYVFQWDGAAWTQLAKLRASDGVAEDLFGYSVCIDQNYAIVGPQGNNALGSGNVYIYEIFTELTPEEQVDATIDFFDEAVDVGSLVGTGGGASADNRLNALRNMLLQAQLLIDAGDTEAACEQLYSAYILCDGNDVPPDFVTGESSDELAEMIWNMMQDLGCAQCLAKRFAPERENETIILPTEYSLEQNQPNPFNPTTTINYTVAKNSHVKLTVYNTLGQVVAELVNGYQAQGSYSVAWNAQKQPSGLYLCRFEADGFTATKKMFLQK